MRQKQSIFSLFLLVALLAEGVDRNSASVGIAAPASWSPSSRRAWIEMQTGGVASMVETGSPSSRRAWIEICRWCHHRRTVWVALLAEGVDRNCTGVPERISLYRVALLAEGVDRNNSSLYR